MKRISIFLLCLLPLYTHAQYALWEAYIQAWAPTLIEFFNDYYGEAADDQDVIDHDEGRDEL